MIDPRGAIGSHFRVIRIFRGWLSAGRLNHETHELHEKWTWSTEMVLGCSRVNRDNRKRFGNRFAMFSRPSALACGSTRGG